MARSSSTMPRAAGLIDHRRPRALGVVATDACPQPVHIYTRDSEELTSQANNIILSKNLEGELRTIESGERGYGHAGPRKLWSERML